MITLHELGFAKTKQPWSTPKGTNTTQILLIYLDWLEKNPASHHYTAVSGIATSLFEAFPKPQ